MCSVRFAIQKGKIFGVTQHGAAEFFELVIGFLSSSQGFWLQVHRSVELWYRTVQHSG